MTLALDAPRTHEATLREVIEHLATLDRPAGSAGEREAAEWLAARLRRARAAVAIDAVPYREGYAHLLAGLCAAGTVGATLALTRRGRRAGGLLGAAAGALVADDISNGPRLVRSTMSPERTTWNVVADAGDPNADRTLVVMAHHDSARTGKVFDQRGSRSFAERFPDYIERTDTAFPLWWPVLGAHGLVALSALLRRRGLGLAALGLTALATASFLDIARSPFVPGANDNLSGVAVLVAVAETLARRPVTGLRVQLVSCGAEEVCQGGVIPYVRDRLRALDPKRTWVLNLDSVGSPNLVMLEGEGPVVMEDYTEPAFRDLVAGVAERAGVPLRRGMRARASTDSVIPSRAGYPTAGFASVDRHKLISNYHQLSDVPENLDYATVAHATTLTEALARELAAGGA